MKKLSIILLYLFLSINLFAQNEDAFKNYISNISIDSLDGTKPQITIKKISKNIFHLIFRFTIVHNITQDDWRVMITPAFKPTFHWSPLLTPSSKNIIAQHVFRSPALIAADSKRQLTIIPDLDLINKQKASNWYMDLDAEQNILTLGLSRSKVTEHVLYEKAKGQVFTPSDLEFGFYVLLDELKPNADHWRSAAGFLWKKWGTPLYKKGEPMQHILEPYVKHTYDWAFDGWKKIVWQEFKINDKQVGAPVFIVNITQSPNYPGPSGEREFRSIWNQSWFSSLRSAQGLYRYAKQNKNDSLLQKALLTKELALSFPMNDGLFPSVIGTPMESVIVDGKQVNRSVGWEHFYFGNSDRNPYARKPETSPYHILDMSWTAYLMLTWYDELEKDERLLQYANAYATKLISLQDDDGFFPAWIDSKTLNPLPVLKQSSETSQSVTFLLKLFQLTKIEKYKIAALKAMKAIMTDIIPTRRWEDFETYWSCSRVFQTQVGEKIKRNNQYKQNTLSMYWTAEALYECYLVTKDRRYLQIGQQVLDEMLMYQASWQPHFIYVHALGGFGVMNADAEWNDARQSLFAELIVNYGKSLKKEEYVERGIAALKASFVMMYCPENPETKLQWEKAHPFFNEKDYGFMMENYGHNGETNKNGLGIGVFTIYDWGNGAASEAYSRMLDHFGKSIFK